MKPMFGERLSINEWIGRATQGVLIVPAGFVLDSRWNPDAGTREYVQTQQAQLVEIELNSAEMNEAIRAALRNKTRRATRGALTVISRGVATHGA